jgi:Global regulator protein family
MSLFPPSFFWMTFFALVLMALVGAAYYAWQSRAERRWLAALDRYADRERAKPAAAPGELTFALRRKLGERFVVPRLGMTVSVLGVDGDVVRLGIAAPAGVSVVREESLITH